MTQKTDIDIRSKKINELKEYIEKEGISIDEDPETIIDKLMCGKLRDIGGLTAIIHFEGNYSSLITKSINLRNEASYFKKLIQLIPPLIIE